MGCPEVESTDLFVGIAPVPLRVRLDPGKPGKIIAVPLSLTAYNKNPLRGRDQRAVYVAGSMNIEPGERRRVLH